MLIGYDNIGEIQFVFTDEFFLKSLEAKLDKKLTANYFSNKWGQNLETLRLDFEFIENYKHFRIIDGDIVRKTTEEIEVYEKSCHSIRKKGEQIINVDQNTTQED